eukprot:1079966-Amphidinium_carterae.1
MFENPKKVHAFSKILLLSPMQLFNYHCNAANAWSECVRSMKEMYSVAEAVQLTCEEDVKVQKEKVRESAKGMEMVIAKAKEMKGRLQGAIKSKKAAASGGVSKRAGVLAVGVREQQVQQMEAAKAKATTQKMRVPLRRTCSILTVLEASEPEIGEA